MKIRDEIHGNDSLPIGYMYEAIDRLPQALLIFSTMFIWSTRTYFDEYTDELDGLNFTL